MPIDRSICRSSNVPSTKDYQWLDEKNTPYLTRYRDLLLWHLCFDFVVEPFRYEDLLPTLRPKLPFGRTDSARMKALSAAYGWPADISDDDALAKLFALNQARAVKQGA